MKKDWSSAWKGSKLPRKQRKYVAKAPMHVQRKFLAVHLSKDLRAKYSRRSVPVREGDKVKVLIGSHRGHVGKVERVDVKKTKVYVGGIEITKKDGMKVVPPIAPSNLLITELRTGDKRRESLLSRNMEQKK